MRLVTICGIGMMVFISTVLFWIPAARPQSPQATEYEIKAVFLAHFAEFVEWPQDRFRSPEDPIVIGIVGKDPFGEILDQAVRGASAQGRPLRVERISEGFERCHILFVGSSEREKVANLLQALGGSSVLTVSDMDGFIEQGGMIRLVLVKKKVRFAVNQGAAERTGLKISSQLLKLAIEVRD